MYHIKTPEIRTFPKLFSLVSRDGFPLPNLFPMELFGSSEISCSSLSLPVISHGKKKSYLQLTQDIQM